MPASNLSGGRHVLLVVLQARGGLQSGSQDLKLRALEVLEQVEPPQSLDLVEVANARDKHSRGGRRHSSVASVEIDQALHDVGKLGKRQFLRLDFWDEMLEDLSKQIAIKILDASCCPAELHEVVRCHGRSPSDKGLREPHKTSEGLELSKLRQKILFDDPATSRSVGRYCCLSRCHRPGTAPLSLLARLLTTMLGLIVGIHPSECLFFSGASAAAAVLSTAAALGIAAIVSRTLRRRTTRRRAATGAHLRLWCKNVNVLSESGAVRLPAP
mmetsp:Transcript_168947/g.543141  ORF Transcript_168947/g.543141 Transcript_168947/m.543141 type:complete len:271 (+) Transcript_168947:565-1377(+)